MPSREEIFDNIAQYTAEQIVNFIKQGVVSAIELEDPDNTGGEYSSDMRDKVNEMLSDHEPQDWAMAQMKDTIEAYQYYLDTYLDGHHREEARIRKKEIQNASAGTTPHEKKQVDDWLRVNKESLPELQAYIDAHPDSPHLAEAKRLRNKIKNRIDTEELSSIDMDALIKKFNNITADKKVLNPDETIYELIVSSLDKNHISINDLIDALSKDKNLLGAKVIHKLYNEGYLTKEDFVSMQIDKEFLQHMLEDVPPQKFSVPEPLNQISRHSTEIYFWGIPSSGKSCALGGILSVANNGKVASHMDKDNHCQGYGYMSRLMLLFDNNGDVGTLPEGTSTTATYEMGFNLTDMEGLVHPITCVDLAGEMIRCMYKFDSGEDMPDDELTTLDTLTRILVDNRTQNRKMHFFVIEYGADDRLYEGLPQRTYLEAAVNYIRNFEIFNRDTDAIFIIITKVDKAPDNLPRNQIVKDYLTRYYNGFINGLKTICKDNDINGGEIDVIPFSLGTVCFQNYCKFNDEAAILVVKKILERTPAYKPDKLNKLIGKLKK